MAFSVMQKMMKGLKDVPQKMRNAANNFAESGGRAVSRNTQAFWDGSSPMRQAGRKNQMFLDQYSQAYAESARAGTTTRGGRRAFRRAQERADRRGLSLNYPRDRNAEEVMERLRVARRQPGKAGHGERDGRRWTKGGYKDLVRPARVTTGNRPFKVPKPEDGQMMHLPGYGTSSTPNAKEIRAANRAKREEALKAGSDKNSSSVFGSGSQLIANAGAGALAGGIVGGLNPMGDDGMLTGAVKGAALGGLMGAAAGHFGRNATGATVRGNQALVMGGGRAGILSNSEAGMKSYSASLATLGGAAGGLIGGSGKKKRNTVIQSNSWSQGTHPQYFGG